MAGPIPLLFFRTAAGTEPVREWLKELPDEDCDAIGRDLERVQHRWPVGHATRTTDWQRLVGSPHKPG
jgi:hypothetical protein